MNGTFPATLARDLVGNSGWNDIVGRLDETTAARAQTTIAALGESATWARQLVARRPATASASSIVTNGPIKAAAAPVDPDLPPVRFFNNPRLAEPTPLTVTPEGHVYGHLAVWGTCHLSHTAKGQCVTPPHSSSGYSYFHTGSILTAEGAEIPVGQITLNTRHAPDDLRASATLAHYDHTGTAVADVCAGEDSHGIWVSGTLRPGLKPETIRVLRASPLSGDWRRIGTNLELVAALAVNVPGFPVPRPSGKVSSGSMYSLVAAGMLPPRRVRRPGTPGALSLDDLRYLKRLAAREKAEAERAKIETLANAESLAQRLRAQHHEETLAEARALHARLQRARVEAMAAKVRGS